MEPLKPELALIDCAVDIDGTMFPQAYIHFGMYQESMKLEFLWKDVRNLEIMYQFFTGNPLPPHIEAFAISDSMILGYYRASTTISCSLN